VLVVAALVGLVVTRIVRRRPPPRRWPGSEPEAASRSGELGLSPEDAAELDARFADAATADATWRDEVVAARMASIVDRRVPLRLIEPIPDRRGTRVRFADGTTIVAHGSAAGDLGVLVAVMGKRSVRVASCVRGADGLHLALDWTGRNRQLDLVVTGLDQPD